MNNTWKVYQCFGCKEKIMVTRKPMYCPYCRLVNSGVYLPEPPIVKRKIINKTRMENASI